MGVHDQPFTGPQRWENQRELTGLGEERVIQATGHWSNCDLWIDAPVAWNALGAVTMRLYGTERSCEVELADGVLSAIPSVLRGDRRLWQALSVRGRPCDGFIVTAQKVGPDLANARFYLEVWGTESTPEFLGEELTDGVPNPRCPQRASHLLGWDSVAGVWRRVAVSAAGAIVVDLGPDVLAADDMANMSAPQILSSLMTFDGATWDRARSGQIGAVAAVDLARILNVLPTMRHNAAVPLLADGTGAVQQATNESRLRVDAQPSRTLSVDFAAADVANGVISAVPATLFSVQGFNAHATATRFFQLYDAIAVPVDGTAPVVLSIQVPPSSHFSHDFSGGRQFTVGIAFANSSTRLVKTTVPADLTLNAMVRIV